MSVAVVLVAGFVLGASWIVVAGALVYALAYALPGRWLYVVLAAWPVPVFAAMQIPSLLSVETLVALFAAWFAWHPLFAALGGHMPRDAAMLVPVAIAMGVLFLPWSASLVAGDVAARGQAVILGAFLLLWTAALPYLSISTFRVSAR